MVTAKAPESSVLACEEQLRQAQLSGDVEALDRLIDESLIFTALGGTLVGKRDDLALHRSGTFRISRMDVIEQQVMDLGEVAVVVTAMEASATIGEAVEEGRLRYTRVWRRFADGWRVVAGHMSTIAP